MTTFLRQFKCSPCFTPWQSLTRAKKQCATLTGLPTPSRSTARICFRRPISSASYARPKSASKPSQASQASQSDKSRSRRADRLGSRFLARFTLFSVSVTLYPALPSGLRPAPFLFPPLADCCMKEYISFLLTNYDSIYILSISQSTSMANKRLSKEKQTLILMALCEGTPINAVHEDVSRRQARGAPGHS